MKGRDNRYSKCKTEKRKRKDTKCGNKEGCGDMGRKRIVKEIIIYGERGMRRYREKRIL